MKNKKAIDVLREFTPCQGAVEWLADKTLEEAWNTCHRGDWMLWAYANLYPNNKKEILLALAHCANTVRHLMKDKRSTDAVDAIFKYVNGEISLDQLEMFYRYAGQAFCDAKTAHSAAIKDACVAYAISKADSYTTADAYNEEYACAFLYAFNCAKTKRNEDIIAASVAYSASNPHITPDAAFISSSIAANAADLICTNVINIANNANGIDIIDTITPSLAVVRVAFTAMTKNQLETADICRKYLTIDFSKWLMHELEDQENVKK